MIQNRADINKISNKYILKSIFEYLDYQYILKLLNYNKKLQNKIGINIENYKKEQNYQYVKRRNLGYFDKEACNPKHLIKIFFCILYLSLVIMFIFLGYFNDFMGIKNHKDYYEEYLKEDYSKIQTIINICDYSWIIGVILVWTTPLIFILGNSISIFCFEKARAILIILSLLSQIIYECISIWRLVLSCKIKDKEIIQDDWILHGLKVLIVIDIIFIIINFIFTIFSFLIFGKNLLRYITTSSIYDNLISINGIKVREYKIPNNFKRLNKKQQLQYILKRYKFIEYVLTKDQIDLIILINKFRKNINLEKLLFDKNNRLPNFIINKPVIIMLNPTQNFFQLSKKEYLFRYHIGEFKIKFQNKENNIITILSKIDINYIKIIGQEEYEYIYLSELLYNEILDIGESKRNNNQKNEDDYDNDYNLFKDD